MKVQLLLQGKIWWLNFHQWWWVMMFIFNKKLYHFENTCYTVFTLNYIVSCTHTKAPKWHFKKGHYPHQSDMPHFIDQVATTEKCKDQWIYLTAAEWHNLIIVLVLPIWEKWLYLNHSFLCRTESDVHINTILA